MNGYIAEYEELGLEVGVFNCDVADWKEQKIGGSHWCDIDQEAGEGESRLSRIEILEEEAIVKGIIIDSKSKRRNAGEVAGKGDCELLIDHGRRWTLIQLNIVGINIAGQHQSRSLYFHDKDSYK